MWWKDFLKNPVQTGWFRCKTKKAAGNSWSIQPGDSDMFFEVVSFYKNDCKSTLIMDTLNAYSTSLPNIYTIDSEISTKGYPVKQ